MFPERVKTAAWPRPACTPGPFTLTVSRALGCSYFMYCLQCQYKVRPRYSVYHWQWHTKMHKPTHSYTPLPTHSYQKRWHNSPVHFWCNRIPFQTIVWSEKLCAHIHTMHTHTHTHLGKVFLKVTDSGSEHSTFKLDVGHQYNLLKSIAEQQVSEPRLQWHGELSLWVILYDTTPIPSVGEAMVGGRGAE